MFAPSFEEYQPFCAVMISAQSLHLITVCTVPLCVCTKRSVKRFGSSSRIVLRRCVRSQPAGELRMGLSQTHYLVHCETSLVMSRPAFSNVAATDDSTLWRFRGVIRQRGTNKCAQQRDRSNANVLGHSDDRRRRVDFVLGSAHKCCRGQPPSFSSAPQRI